MSGGNEGQIRVWRIDSEQQNLITILKEHTAPVASLQFNCFDREIVSSSSDGTCIIWDIAYVVCIMLDIKFLSSFIFVFN